MVENRLPRIFDTPREPALESWIAISSGQQSYQILTVSSISDGFHPDSIALGVAKRLDGGMANQTDIDRYNQINTDLYDNADYLELDSLSKATAYYTALNRAIDFRPQVSSRGSQGDELRFDLVTLERKLRDVKKWISHAKTATSPGGFFQRGTARCDSPSGYYS